MPRIVKSTIGKRNFQTKIIHEKGWLSVKGLSKSVNPSHIYYISYVKQRKEQKHNMSNKFV